jgi:cytochrome P450
MIRGQVATLRSVRERLLFFMDGPRHEESRRKVAALLRRRTAAIERELEALWQRRWKTLEVGVTADLLDVLLIPCVTEAFQLLLGCPEKIASSLHQWSTVFNNSMSGLSTAEEYADAEAAVRDLVETIRAETGRPWVDALFEQGAGGLFDADERMSTLILLLLAGFDTTLSMLSNVILCIVESGEQRGPSDFDLAGPLTTQRVCPVNFTMREAIEDLTLDGTSIAKGERVLISWIGGNASLAKGEVDLLKKGFAFGFGTHSCLGRGLALLQLDACLRAWRRGGYWLRLAGEVPFNENACFHRPLALPVRL